MRTTKLYEDRGLDLHELWKRANRKPPGSILVLPRETPGAKGQPAPNGEARPNGASPRDERQG